jgi:hypothetical protein
MHERHEKEVTKDMVGVYRSGMSRSCRRYHWEVGGGKLVGVRGVA